MSKNKFTNSEYFFNRELSWLEFNERVLQETTDPKNPFFERLKFMAIVCSNLDEFFMVRAASLKDLVNAGFKKPDPSGLLPKEQLKYISVRTHNMYSDIYEILNKSLLPQLKEVAISFVKKEDLSLRQVNFLDNYFKKFLYPVLTPLAVDINRPFPLIFNKSLNLGILLKNESLEAGYIFAAVQVPGVTARIIELPTEKQAKQFILLEDVMAKYIEQLFVGSEIIACQPYRITRNADLTIEEDEAEDLLIEIEKSLKERKWGQAIRLEVDKNMDQRVVKILKESLEIHHRDIYYIDGPLDLTYLMKIYELDSFNHLKYPEYIPQVPQDLLVEEDIFETVRKEDILFHHPYESFAPIVGFVQKAAEDPQVLAIKQTLYRVSGDSPIIEALARAAENGKEVTVLVELKARFDEENNITWARKLEKAGCHVIYGLLGLKTHCKIILVVRMEEDGIKRYVHLGTGNYNDITAKLYTDIGLMTANENFCADTSAIFNMLSGYSEPPELYKLYFAPISLREKFTELIEREIEHAQAGREAKITAKMNSLVDPEIIATLYNASKSGVQIKLLVRGICCLRPGIPGVSENITVISIVGRYLEHSRIYYFYNNSNEEIYISSADWMPRNLNRRVELLIPVENRRLRKRLSEILKICLQDTAKARILRYDGLYYRVEQDQGYFKSQGYFQSRAIKKVKKNQETTNGPSFAPVFYKDLES